jgi:murein DD-endopeptidase MepM/ murein hydrolase activator NlpD
MYGVSVNTILWANDIDNPKSVQPGDTLVILPITGVRHVVKSKETLATIAKKYGAETPEQVEAMVSDMLSYNRLASASEISVGDTVVVPGGVMHQAAPTKSVAKTSKPTRTTGGASGGGSFIHPVPGAVRTQGIHGYNAVDLAAANGTSIRAAAAGEVIVAKSGGWNGGYGSYVVVKHANGVQTLYAHMSSVAVGVGAKVDAGESIGGVGNTGRSTGNHLHFEVRGASNPF